MRGRLVGQVGAALLGATLAVTLAAQPAGADPPSGLPSAETVSAIRRYLEREVAERGLPGAEFSLVHDHAVVTSMATGVADASGRALTPETPILLASLTKSLTATAVLQQVEAGRIRLAAPVVTYLPWFRTADPRESAVITVAEVLHHTSGIPIETPSENRGLDDHSASALEKGIRRLRRTELESRPGSTYLYSNTNYNIAGLIVQTVSGEPYANYLSRHILRPAGMRTAFVGQTDGQRTAAAGFYSWYGGQYRPTSVPEPGGMAPSAIVYASAADLAQLLIMNLNGGVVGGTRILTAQSVAELQRPAAEVDDYTAYAMGWMVRPGWEFDVPTAQTTTSTLPLLIEHEGSWPTTKTYLGFLPQQKLGFALLINANQPATESELSSLTTGVWRILAGQQPKTYPASEVVLRRYGWQVGLGIVIILLLSLGSAVLLLRRRRPRAIVRMLTVFAGLLLTDIGVLGLIWLYLPTAFDNTTYAIARANPDIGILLATATLLIIIWAPIRTVLALRKASRAHGGSRPQVDLRWRDGAERYTRAGDEPG